MGIVRLNYKYECDECGWTWYSDDAEEDCPECGSSDCYHFEQ